MVSFLMATFPVDPGLRLAARLDAFHPHRLQVLDAAVVEWRITDLRPRTWQARPLDDRRALSGAFWGHLLAHTILLPLSHVDEPTPPEGTVVSEGGAPLSHVGLHPRLLDALRAAITPGTLTVLALYDEKHGLEGMETLTQGSTFSAHARLSPVEERRLYAGFGDRLETPSS